MTARQTGPPPRRGAPALMPVSAGASHLWPHALPALRNSDAR
ncbi:hypothetical protein FTUN_2522 [Frigoriglobus tundricola]|uniref:Uncharacterized protein n=1 Tax=Frigoriglobus tundricola TaxID=2774151 RepID=A0A6M5YNT7_9BACT|nr:hypothetical protein FTUN_2522 [Frigoriglobus tundricola]